jgi:hypothetical protein
MSVSPWKSDSQSYRHPFKTPPLRLPGQSIDERITSIQLYVDDYLTYALCFLVIAWYQWFQWWIERPIHPIVFTFAAIIVIGFAALRIQSLKSDISNLRLGKDGERVVADMLDPLRERGYRVFHDIPGPNFNIDHVIIGPGGVFTIETKARTRPMQGRPTVVYDGNVLRIGNGKPTVKPLEQARNQARWLAEFLNDGRRGTLFSVRPVVVFPEWFIERRERGGQSDVWVLNPKELGGFLDHEPCVLSAELIDTAAQILTAWDRQSYKATA